MKTALNEDMTMDEIMRQSPARIRVVLDYGLLCVGCPIASFHTIADAVREHDVDAARFILDLSKAGGPEPGKK